MDTLQHFHFIRPFWLLAILPAVAIGIALLRANLIKGNWNGVIAQHLLPYLIDKPSNSRGVNPLLALIPLWVIACVALAGPTWQKIAQPLKQDLSAAVILWDLSPSMLAEDLKPSRAARAKYKLIDLFDKRETGLSGLVAYAGEAHIVTPLTDDSRTVKNLLNGLSPDMMPVRGSNPEMALELAVKLLKEGGVERGDIIFVSDGIDPAAFYKLEDLIAPTQHRVTVWGFGSEQGAPIPLGNNQGFAKTRSGEIVMTKRNDNELSDAAVAMGGIYIPFTSTNADVESIAASLGAADKSATKESTKEFDLWEESGYYLVFLLLPFAAISFRRGWLFSIALIGLMAPTENVHANIWDDLWLNENQQAQRALDNGDAATASKKFKDPQWKAIAEYKQQNYEQAAELFAGESANDVYNRANALTQLEQYDEAIAAYDQALAQNPALAKAKHNKEIAEKLKALKEQQQQNGEQGEDSQDGEQGENSDSQNQDGQQGEQNGEQSDNQQSQQDGQQQGNDGEDSEQPGDPSESKEQAISDEQQQALEEKYGQQGEQQEQPTSDEQDKEAAQQADNQAGEEEAQNEEEGQQQAMQQGEKTDEQQQAEQQALMQMSQEQSEEQQALEQWLRKVPDDPSGLLRNKFYTESRKRRADSRPSVFTLEDDPKKRW